MITLCVIYLRAILLAIIINSGMMEAAPPSELDEVPTAQLPGTEATNAGKAIRALFNTIEEREKLQGYDLSVEMRERPERFIADIPAIQAAIAIEHCDWAVPHEWGAVVPHVSAITGYSSILIAEARAAAGRNEPDVAARHIISVYKLAHHTTRAMSMVECHVAARHTRSAAELILELIEQNRLSPAHAEALLAASAWLTNPDPFNARHALRTQADIIRKPLRTGVLGEVSFATIDPYTNWNGPGRIVGALIAQPVHDAIDRIADIWLDPDFDHKFQLILTEYRPRLFGHEWLIDTYHAPHQRLADSISANTAARDALAKLKDQAAP